MEHSERKHALLSASKSSRWMACPPSARLEEKYTKESSVYADEGTLAHEMSEVILSYWFGRMTLEDYDSRMHHLSASELYSEDMLDYVSVYTEYVIQQYQSYKVKNPDTRIFLEEQIDLREFIPDGFGTTDTAIVSDVVLEVIDLKYGKGIKVFSDDNSQLKLYAVGTYQKVSLMFNITTIRMTIVQPRKGSIETTDMSPEELLKWAYSEVKKKALLATEGKGELNPGEHCKFCKHKNRCKALSDKAISVAKYEFAKEKEIQLKELPSSNTLTNEELVDVWEKGEMLVQWYNSISSYIYEQSLSGVKFPGYKLVEGKANRKIVDEESAKETLMLEGISQDKFLNVKMKGIGDLEKLLTKAKFNLLLGPFVKKPLGNPVLVSESDPRPEIGSKKSATEEFKIEN